MNKSKSLYQFDKNINQNNMKTNVFFSKYGDGKKDQIERKKSLLCSMEHNMQVHLIELCCLASMLLGFTLNAIKSSQEVS